MIGNTVDGGGISLTDGALYTLISNNVILNSTGPGVMISFYSVPIGGTGSRYDITDRGSNVFRYTWDGTGTDPGFTSVFPGTDARVHISSGPSAVNTGFFDVVACGTNYIEVYNPNGSAENDQVISSAYFTYTKAKGNVINNNIIKDNKKLGIYFGGMYQPVEVANNVLIGNHWDTDDNWGGRVMACNLGGIMEFADVHHNTILRKGNKPKYGINVYTASTMNERVNGSIVTNRLINIHDNAVREGGYISDFYDVSNKSSGQLKMWTYQREDEPDDSDFDIPFNAITGLLFVQIGSSEAGLFLVGPTGVVTLVSGTSNCSVTDADGKLVVYNYPSLPNAVRVRNRLGSALPIRMMLFYN